MKEIIITTQEQLDALPDAFSEHTIIKISAGTLYDPIIVRKARESSHVEAWESSRVVAWGSSHVVARESSRVVARESSHVEAWESSHVVAWGSSHVVAWGSSHVEAWESSRVVAWESSHVVAWGSSHVVAWGSSHVVAWESSHVVAWGSSHVVARESSRVVARESSHVEAWESSRVVAWGSVSVHVQSKCSIVELFGFAVAILLAAAKVSQKSKTTIVIHPKLQSGNSGWLDRQGITATQKTVTLYKRVSKEFKTQEGTKNETLWTVGISVEHPAWNPKEAECGEGKFHACSRPYFCDEFRNEPSDRYIAIAIKVAHLFAWDNGSYPHKCGFKAGTVLHEVDRYGAKL